MSQPTSTRAEFRDPSLIGMTSVPNSPPPTPNNQLQLQSPTIVIPGMPKTIKSCSLIFFGIILFLLSAAHVGLSAWVVSLVNYAVFSAFSLACGIIFLLLSFLSMYGGCDVGRRKYAIIWCIILGLLGLAVAVAAAVANLVALGAYPEECSLCKIRLDVSATNFGVHAGCSAMCYIAYEPVHIGLAGIALIEGLIGFILSLSSCCNTCSCCCCYEESHSEGFILPSSGPPSQYPPSSISYAPLSSGPERIA